MLTIIIGALLFMQLPQDHQETTSRKPMSCGVASIYGVCKLMGRDCSLDQIEEVCLAEGPDVDLSALSLFQIAEAFSKLGFQAVPRFCSPKKGLVLHTPFVAYFSPENLGSLQSKVGHVAIVTRMDSDMVHLLDLTEASDPIKASLSQFLDGWSGYYLEIRKEGATGHSIFSGKYAWFLVSLISVLFVCIFRFLPTIRKSDFVDDKQRLSATRVKKDAESN